MTPAALDDWEGDRPYRTSPRTVAVVIALAIAFTALFVMSPPLYTRLGSEGGVIETASAWFLFACSGLLAGAARRVRRADTPDARRHSLLLGLGAFMFFMIGGEEISWFQRVLDIETPAMFGGNLQNEMNLHNFETNAIEVAYYCTAWAIVVALPFAMDHFPPARDVALLRGFAPDRLMIALAAPMVGYTHDQWNQAPSQLMVYATALVLLVYVRRAAGTERACFVASLAAFVAIQAAYLTWGERFIRYWDVTEYREFFIPLALLVWCVQLFRRAGTARPLPRTIVPAT